MPLRFLSRIEIYEGDIEIVFISFWILCIGLRIDKLRRKDATD